VFNKIKQQQEMTTKLILVVIGLTSVSAILVPTYAAPAIRSADIVNGEVKTEDLANGAVTNAKIANNAVTSPKIQNGQVSTDDLANNAVTTGKIADGTIQEEDIEDGVIPPEGGGGGTTGKIETVYKIEQTNIQPGQQGDVTADCDASHPVATGGGFDMETANPQLLVLGSTPAPLGNNPPIATGWHAHALNEDPNNSHILGAYVICSNIVP
jgi:hypothetical protein